MAEMDKIALRYHDTPPFRILIQALPYGGSLDTLLAWRGSKLQQERINRWLLEMERSLGALDSAAVQYSDFETEEGADLLMAAMRAAARHRSHRRIKALADIVVKRAQGFEGWDEAEDAVRVIDDLEDLDLALLLKSSEFYMDSGAFAGGRVFEMLPNQLSEREQWLQEEEPKKLTDVFPDVPDPQLHFGAAPLLRS